jgi:uncharacterized protein (DUF2236 family)
MCSALSSTINTMSRAAKDIIDSAIKENRANEYLLYLFAVVAFAIGTLVIGWSLVKDRPLATLAGSIETGLFAPAVLSTRQIRKENLKLRMLEIPLSYAKTAEEAARAIVTLYLNDSSDNRRGKSVDAST